MINKRTSFFMVFLITSVALGIFPIAVEAHSGHWHGACQYPGPSNTPCGSVNLDISGTSYYWGATLDCGGRASWCPGGSAGMYNMLYHWDWCGNAGDGACGVWAGDFKESGDGSPSPSTIRGQSFTSGSGGVPMRSCGRVQVDVGVDDVGDYVLAGDVWNSGINCDSGDIDPTPTPGSGPTCSSDNVNMSYSPAPANTGSSITFSLAGSSEGNTWIEDYWSGGVSDCNSFPSPSSETCNAVSAGTYTWTHKWKRCEGSFGICSSLCEKQLSYSISASTTHAPTPTNAPTPTPSPTPTRMPDPWVQTQGGDVYASRDIRSSLPGDDPPYAFSVNGPGGHPGVVAYGSSFQFAASEKGRGNVAKGNTDWLVKENSPYAQISLYTTFYTLLGAPTAIDWLTGNPLPCASCTHYAKGDRTIALPLSVSATQKMIVLVDGTLTINNTIRIAPGGFIAFIVSGNISVSRDVGYDDAGAYPPTQRANIEGVYIATGDILTGSGNKKLIAEGMFIANNFNLNRNLGGSQNVDNPSEFFLYAPRFLVSIPDEMKETILRWEEIVP